MTIVQQYLVLSLLIQQPRCKQKHGMACYPLNPLITFRMKAEY